jgi:hypothetical protein
MSRITKFQILCLVVITLLVLPGWLAAQEDTTPARPPAPAVVARPAPRPAQILTGKRVFISNAGGELSNWFTGGSDRLYNQFYAAMKDWGRYELVAAPADADLIFEIRVTGAYLSEREEIPKFELAILDPKTHVILWGFAERLNLALLKGHRDENFDKGMNKLMGRVKQLVEQDHN